MGVDDRMFEAPAADLAKIRERLNRLPPPLRDLIQRTGNALALGDLTGAQAALADALACAPGQPDVLRLHGLLLSKVGNLPAAMADFEAAIRAVPDDAMGYWQYAQIREETGDVAGALRVREQAVQRSPDSPMAWADLGEHLSRHRDVARALPAIERALALAPDYAPAQLKLGTTLVACGRTREGAAAVRKAIAIEPAFGAAWLDLVDIKTVPVTDAEVAQMRGLLRGRNIDEGERTAMEFALGRACEDRALYDEAFDVLVDANTRRKREIGTWNARQFVARQHLAEEAFAAPHAVAGDPRLGEEVIFIAGLPRSGSTLVEQILASHPAVQGTGERGELAQVLTEESTRRQQRFPEWVTAAVPDDWQRLGLRYLELMARSRDACPHFTDKMPNNWQALGAIRAMLPGARVVMCRRDPLENCWSCYKQYFPSGWTFTYDVEDLATFWKAFDRAASGWSARCPDRVRQQGYEKLTESPESEIRALLDFCGLPFDAACLRAHESPRAVHTLSAAQVRQPLRRHVDVASAYGSLLDPLRAALGLIPPAGSAAHATSA